MSMYRFGFIFGRSSVLKHRITVLRLQETGLARG